MFDSLESTHRSESLQRLLAFLVSSLGHVVAIFVFVLLPLVYFNVLPAEDLLTFLVAPPSPPAPLPPPPPVRSEKSAAVSRVEGISYNPPERIPDGVPPPTDEPPMVDPSALQLGTGLGMLVGPVGPGTGIRSGVLESAEPPLVPPLPPPPPSHKVQPLVVGGKVQESKLLRKVEPVYPELARRARVSGMVVLEVIVDEEGNVSEIKVPQGHPLLTGEAVRAVSAWKYSPTLLNGEPVPVRAAVTVIFNLSQR